MGVMDSERRKMGGFLSPKSEYILLSRMSPDLVMFGRDSN